MGLLYPNKRATPTATNHGSSGLLGTSSHSTATHPHHTTTAGTGLGSSHHTGTIGPGPGLGHSSAGVGGHSSLGREKHVSSHHNTGVNPGIGSKIAGTVESAVGKMTNNPHKVIDGEAKKGNNVGVTKGSKHL